MLKNITKNNKYIPLAIFLFFFFITLAIHSFSPYFSMPDDPYYHARESASMLMGEKTVMPAFSTLSHKTVDLYYLYHLTMAPFTYFFKGDNYEALIMGVKIYQSILVASLFLIFYLILRGILRKKISDKGEKAITLQSLLGTLLLFAISPSFTFRIIEERPLILSIMAMLAIFYFIINKRWKLVFLITMALPFFYSASFLILMPSFVFLFVSFFIPTIPAREKWWPIIITTLGLIIGIILRPDSLAYLYNGYLAIIFSIIDAMSFRIHALFLGNMNHATGELQSGTPFYESWSSIFFLIWLAVSYVYLKLKVTKNRIAMEDVFLFFTSGVFVLGSLVVARLIEYALPFAILFCFSTQNEWGHYLTYLPSKIKKSKKTIFYGMLICLFIINFTQTNYIITLASLQFRNNYQQYKGASLYLKEHIKPRSIVYLEGSIFPQLFLYNPMISYSGGMDTIFRKLQDYSLYQKTVAFDNGESSADFLKDANVQYILIDERFIGFSDVDAEKFLQNIQNDKNLVFRYQDPNYPYILIYGFK